MIFLLAALVVGHAHAMNKCTDSKTGKVNYSDKPCPTAETNTKMEWVPKAHTNVVQGGGGGRERREPNGNADAPPEAAPLISLYRRWIDAERLAGATGRIALSTPVASMQALQREAEATRVAACVVKAKENLVKLIGGSVEAYIQFMKKDELTSQYYQVLDRDKLIGAFEQELSAAQCKA